MAHNLAEELVPDVSNYFIAYPVHVVSIPVVAKTAHRHDKRDGEANPNDRVDLWTHIQHLMIGQESAWVGRRAVENEGRYLQDGQGNQRIDHAEGKTKRQAKHKPPLVGLDVAVEPPVRARCRPKSLPKRGLFLAGLSVLHEVRVVA